MDPLGMLNHKPWVLYLRHVVSSFWIKTWGRRPIWYAIFVEKTASHKLESTTYFHGRRLNMLSIEKHVGVNKKSRLEQADLFRNPTGFPVTTLCLDIPPSLRKPIYVPIWGVEYICCHLPKGLRAYEDLNAPLISPYFLGMALRRKSVPFHMSHWKKSTLPRHKRAPF